MRPYCASRRIIGAFRRVANQLSTRCDCAVTSGPMPSPPTTATLVMLDRLFMSFPCNVYPRALSAIGGLECSDFMLTSQRELYFVEGVEQSVATSRVDLETVSRSRWRGDGLLMQV